MCKMAKRRGVPPKPFLKLLNEMADCRPAFEMKRGDRALELLIHRETKKGQAGATRSGPFS